MASPDRQDSSKGQKPIDVDSLKRLQSETETEPVEEIKTIESLESLWNLLPKDITIMVGANPKIHLNYVPLFGANHPLVKRIGNLLQNLGKQVRFESIGDEQGDDWRIELNIQSDVLSFSVGCDDKARELSTIKRFDENRCRLIATASPNIKTPEELGLIGAVETGHIRNAYFVVGDGLDMQLTDDYKAYIRSNANGLRNTHLSDSIPLIDQFCAIATALTGNFKPEEIIVYEGHFTDHILYSRLNGGLTPQDLLDAVSNIFPNATSRIIEVSDDARSIKAAYSEYPSYLPEVQEMENLYKDGKKRIVFYDRHAWGIFNLCPRGDLAEGTWYYNPRSTGDTILLQLPDENLEGSLLTKAMTPEARAVFDSAGLTNPYSDDELDSMAADALSTIARKWLSERGGV